MSHPALYHWVNISYTMIGTKIRKFRELRNLTQEHMAARLNIEQNTYSRYESGQIGISTRRHQQIAEILCVSTEELLRTGSVVGSVQPDPLSKAQSLADASDSAMIHRMWTHIEERTQRLEDLYARTLDLLSKVTPRSGD